MGGSGPHNIINDFLGRPRSSEFVEEQRDCIIKFFNAFARYMNNASGFHREFDKMPTASRMGGFDKWLAELLRRVGAEDYKIMREQIYRYQTPQDGRSEGQRLRQISFILFAKHANRNEQVLARERRIQVSDRPRAPPIRG